MVEKNIYLAGKPQGEGHRPLLKYYNSYFNIDHDHVREELIPLHLNYKKQKSEEFLLQPLYIQCSKIIFLSLSLPDILMYRLVCKHYYNVSKKYWMMRRLYTKHTMSCSFGYASFQEVYKASRDLI